MIWMKDLLWCIITPPKCASTSLHTYLCDQQNNVYVVGPQLVGDHSEKHTTVLPYGVRWPEQHPKLNKKYQIGLVVRNPYARAVSLWGHARDWDDLIHVEFDHFVKHILMPVQQPFLSSTISRIMHNFEKPVAKLFHVESLVEDFTAIGADMSSFPHYNKVDHPPYTELYTQELMDLVYYWGQKDFQDYHYDHKVLPDDLQHPRE